MTRPCAATSNATASSVARRHSTLGLGLAGLALLAAGLSSAKSSCFTAGSSSLAAFRPPRGESAVAMRAKRLSTQPQYEGRNPGYSNYDRERLARRRQEIRELNRAKEKRTGKLGGSLNYEMLPSVQDIYSRQFTGDIAKDPKGGRKRYSLLIAFKHDPQKAGPEVLKKNILDYIQFMKKKMSCDKVEANSMVSPIDQRSPVTTLEYPMREYGELQTGEKHKKVYQKAVLVRMTFYAPPDAIDYIRGRIYKDNMVLRHVFLGHTRDFRDLGEDNELHL